MKTTVLTNLNSQGAQRNEALLHRALAAAPAVKLIAMHCPNDISTALAESECAPGDLLVIHGGDGTVQRILSELARKLPHSAWPRIAMLPGGTTNMTAYDINLQRRFADCLQRLTEYVNGTATLSETARPLVQVTCANSVQLGFFFGVGDIVRGIEYFHDRLRLNGVRNETGAGLALLRTAWCIMRNRPPFDQPLQVTIDSSHQPDAVRLLLVTALERLFLGFRPYWGDPTQGPVKCTFVAHHARSFFTSLPALLRGMTQPAHAARRRLS